MTARERDAATLLLHDAHVRGALGEILRATAGGRAHLSEMIQQTLRARKNLSSVRRRTVADAAYAMVRCERTVDYLLRVGGADGGVGLLNLSDEDFRECRYVVAVMTAYGVEGYDIATAGFSEAACRMALAVGDVSARVEAIGDPLRRLAVRASVSDWLAERLVAAQGAERAEAFLAASNARAPLVVRANVGRMDREQVRDRLAAEDVQATPTELSPWGLRLGRRINIRGLHAFRRGLIEAQDEGSQLIALIVDPPADGRVLDFCAGAGGKTLALAAMMGGSGQVLATDIDGRRLARMKRRLERARAANVELAFPDRPLPRAWSKGVDRVLVDAPCSGSGTLRRNPGARVRLNADGVARLRDVQREVLEGGADRTRRGGRVIYATCSVLPEENEDLVADVIADRHDLELMPLTEVVGLELAERAGDGTYLRMEPQRHDSDGFFAAVLRRR